MLYSLGLSARWRARGSGLRVLCEKWNEWAFDLAAVHQNAARGRDGLVTDPQHAADRIATLAAAVRRVPDPSTRTERRQQISYAPLWRHSATRAPGDLPLRGDADVLTDPMPFDLALSHVGRATVVRRSADVLGAATRVALVSMILSGVFAPSELKVVVAGYGAAGFRTRSAHGRAVPCVRSARGSRARPDEALDERRVRERAGFSFPAGVLPSDHFGRTSTRGQRDEADLDAERRRRTSPSASSHVVGSKVEPARDAFGTDATRASIRARCR